MLSNISYGKQAPQVVNVIIEIPAHSEPIKYEVDKKTGALFVDRLMSTSMRYPCNYGYIPNTLSDDGDPVDVLVITPFPLINNSVITSRPIGVLVMEDEAGLDHKILCVPTQDITPLYDNIQNPEDLPPLILDQIAHFFEHYKDLDPEKWVKIRGWESARHALEIIERGLEK